MRVCHFTTVHNYYDVRILFRECKSLVDAGYEVDLIAPSKVDQIVEGVKVVSIPKFKFRFKRILYGQYYLLRRLFEKDYLLYHFHDPELIPIALFLRLIGKKVIYDIHENIAEQIKTKDWLPARIMFSRIYSLLELIPVKTMSLILAETSYELNYKERTKNYRVILNMPNIKFFEEYRIMDRSRSDNGVFYIGGVSENRGIFQVIKALAILKSKNIDFHFHCIGKLDEGVYELILAMKEYPEVSDQITFYGSMDIKNGFEISRSCKVGISVLKPIGNYVESYSTKIFEYMAVGLPVITSNFELYIDVIERNNCGICVDPLNEFDVADALHTMLTNTELTYEYGRNGLNAVEKAYSWSNQEAILIDFYDEIINSRS